MKIKKIIAVIMTATMVMSLAACGSGSKSSTTDTGASTDNSEVSGAADAADDSAAATNPGQGTKKMGVVYVGAIDDYGYNEALHKSCGEVSEKLGLEYVYLDNVPESSDVVSAMEQLIADGCGIIYATSYGYREYVDQICNNYPQVAFFGSNQTSTVESSNVATLTTNLWDAAYANGVMAGLMTKTNELGYICSFEMPSVVASINAFTLGAQSVNPDIAVHAIFTQSWADTGLQTDAVNSMLAMEIDVIAQYQDYTKAICEQCEEAGIYCVGYHVDSTRDLAPNAFIAGSVDKFEKQEEVFKMTLDGNFAGIESELGYKDFIVRGGYKEGMVGNAEAGDFCTDEAKKAYQDTINGLIDGSIVVFQGEIKDNKGSVAVAEGQTLTDTELDAMDWFVEGVVTSADNTAN